MKLNSFALAAAAMLCIFASCKKEVDYGTPNIAFDSVVLNIPAAGDTKTVQLTATVAWSVEGQIPEWLQISPLSGDPSKEVQTITVTVTPNKGEERTATVTVKGGDLKADVTINQEYFLPEVKTVKVGDLPKDGYKYQRYTVSGVVKQLSDAKNGVFNIVDETGSAKVNGLEKAEVKYGTQPSGKFADLGVAERDEVTVTGYVLDGAIVYAYLGEVKKYTEANPDEAQTVSFPFTAAFSGSDCGFIVNNPVFPFALDNIWSTGSNGITASAYTDASTLDAEAWLISPFIDMAGAEKPILVFDHTVMYFESIEVAKQQTALMIREKGGEWKQVSLSFSYPDDLGESVMTSQDVNLAEYVGKTIQFAFRYVASEDKEAGNWSIIKVEVKKNEEPEQPDNSNGTEDYNKPGWNW